MAMDSQTDYSDTEINNHAHKVQIVEQSVDGRYWSQDIGAKRIPNETENNTLDCYSPKNQTKYNPSLKVGKIFQVIKDPQRLIERELQAKKRDRDREQS